MNEFNKLTDKILFIDLPPFTLYNDTAVSHKGVNYLRSYLNMNEIKNDCFLLSYDFIYNMYTDYMITTTMHLKKKMYSDEHTKALRKTVKENLIPKLDEYNILAFSIFSFNSSIIFECLYDILNEEIDLSNHKIVLGGNYLRFPNIRQKFEKYTEYLCTSFGEQYFQELYDLPDFKMYSYSQHIEPDELELYKNNFKITDNLITPITVFFGDSCINHCYFCINSLRKEKLSFRDIDDTIREIVFLMRNDISHFVLDTENLPSNYKFSNKFTKKLKIINHSKRITWTANFSPFNEYGLSYKNLNMQDLYDSGCSVLLMGIESFSRKVRALLGKPDYSNEELYEFFDYALSIGFKLEINLFTGFFTETTDDFEEAYDELKAFLHAYENRIYKLTVSIYDIVQEEEIGNWYNGETIEYDDDGYWFYKDNTFAERKRRWYKTYELIDNNNIATRQNFNISRSKVKIL